VSADKWIRFFRLLGDVFSGLEKVFLTRPDGPPVKFPRSMRAEIAEIVSATPPGRSLYIRQARLGSQPAMFVISTAAEPGPEDGSDVVIEGQWALDTGEWTPEQVSAWPEFLDPKAWTAEIEVPETDTADTADTAAAQAAGDSSDRKEKD
jgi:hypothetical protein